MWGTGLYDMTFSPQLFSTQTCLTAGPSRCSLISMQIDQKTLLFSFIFTSYLSQKKTRYNYRNAHLGENKITCGSACCMA